MQLTESMVTESRTLESLSPPEFQRGGSDRSIISVRDVTMRFPIPKRYREIVLHPFRARQVCTALVGASLEVRAGDRIAVMGPNGAGKTTLLRLMGGLFLPTQGDVIVNGFSTLERNVDARKSVGFVFNEERSFFWRLDAIQNLEFFGALDNLWGDELKQRIEQLIAMVGLENAARKPISTYSSGMKQRLALARGLIGEPEILILDEPTRALDPMACDELTELLVERLHRGAQKTLLIATHRPEEAMKLCDKVMLIDQGHVKALDNIADLTASGITVSQYYRKHLAVDQG